MVNGRWDNHRDIHRDAHRDNDRDGRDHCRYNIYIYLLEYCRYDRVNVNIKNKHDGLRKMG